MIFNNKNRFLCCSFLVTNLEITMISFRTNTGWYSACRLKDSLVAFSVQAAVVKQLSELQAFPSGSTISLYYLPSTRLSSKLITTKPTDAVFIEPTEFVPENVPLWIEISFQTQAIDHSQRPDNIIRWC